MFLTWGNRIIYSISASYLVESLLKEINDPEFLCRVCALDPAAITAIYDQYSPGIYRYAMRLMGVSEMAEECVAETFSRFLAALSAGRGPKEYLQAYLYRIAHNWIVDFYRRNPPLVDLNERKLADETHEKMIGAVEIALQQKRVRRALAQLNREQHQVIVLRYLEEWEVDEIAHALQKPEGAVRALLHRAVVKLRGLLHGEDLRNENGYETEISA